MITRDDEKEVIKYMEQEFNLFTKLAHLSVRLKDAVSDSENYLLIERILDEKSCIAEEIERISGMRRSLTISSSLNNDSIVQLTGKIRGILIKIIEYERICEEELIKTRKSIGDKLLTINSRLQLAKTFPKGAKPPEYLSIKL